MRVDAVMSQKDIDCQSVSSDENSRDIDASGTNKPRVEPPKNLLDADLESSFDSDQPCLINQTLAELVQNLELRGEKLLEKIEI